MCLSLLPSQMSIKTSLGVFFRVKIKLMLRKIPFLLFIISILLFASAIILESVNYAKAATNSFTRNLSLGSTGDDVKQLQIFLNSDPITTVSSDGPGSKGQETTFFGQKTANAVTRFQEKYKKDVLLPAGLILGTGYVGNMTRNKLNSLFSSITLNSTDAFKTENIGILNGVLSQKQAFTAVFPNEIDVFGTSHTKVKAGDLLSLVGYGFDLDTVINIGNSSVIMAKATSSTEVTIKIPELAYGKYDLWASNSKGSSKINTPVSITVDSVSDKRPSISSVSPSIARDGDTITVKADTFDPTGNKIYSSLGTIGSLPSFDGHTITFRVNQLPNATKFFENDKINQFAVTFGIGTEQGLSINYGYFLLKK
jgi:peptidoglycan hydrolase-like protein with peptidoglycan-binding domain